MKRALDIVFLLLAACAAEPGPAGWTLGPAALEGDLIVVQLSLAAAFEDLQPHADGAVDQTVRPIAGARFEVLGPGDGLLAHGVTGAAGDAAVSFEASPGLPVRVRVLALTAYRAAAVAVRNDDHAIHAVEAGPVPAAETLEIQVLADAGAAGPAFNLFDGVSRAVLELAMRYGPLQGLDVVWTAGLARSCGSCYLPWAAAVLVGAGEEDPDGWDDSVVLHELGHWFEETLAASTNPGGFHDGSPTWPDQAWSEGFASFFGQAWLGTPVYVDSFQGGAWSMDLERMPGSHAWGTGGGALDGAVSENLVAAVLWDLHDAGAAEPHDHLAAGLLPVLDPAAAWLGLADRPDAGAHGVDLADYLTGWLATGNARWWEVAEIVLARAYPYPFHSPPLP